MAIFCSSLLILHPAAVHSIPLQDSSMSSLVSPATDVSNKRSNLCQRPVLFPRVELLKLVESPDLGRVMTLQVLATIMWKQNKNLGEQLGRDVNNWPTETEKSKRLWSSYTITDMQTPVWSWIITEWQIGGKPRMEGEKDTGPVMSEKERYSSNVSRATISLSFNLFLSPVAYWFRRLICEKERLHKTEYTVNCWRKWLSWVYDDLQISCKMIIFCQEIILKILVALLS